jgi:hypothetical protein
MAASIRKSLFHSLDESDLLAEERELFEGFAQFLGPSSKLDLDALHSELEKVANCEKILQKGFLKLFLRSNSNNRNS